MKKQPKFSILAIIITLIAFAFSQKTEACSSFKLQKGKELLYGHNLNENGINVPGMIFINKRGIFKQGRTWSELVNKIPTNPSELTWVSRYGSVTFNCFGKDFPDGGMNEAGLYIWEMNEDAVYPKGDSLPKIMHMNWMQYVLDNYSTLEEALQSASEFEIDGWGWHYFVADANGNCASIHFDNGKPTIHTGDQMPVPALFNTPYQREMEVLKYFKGYGGQYEIDLADIEVPRFAKTAKLIQDYDPAQDAVQYGLMMLETIKVQEIPKWSVLFDVNKRTVHFKTKLNPKVKSFSMNELDFSNAGPALVQNIDIEKGGDIKNLFHAYTNKEMKKFIKDLPLPDEFFGMGGLSRKEFAERYSNHADVASKPKNHFFKGVWKTKLDKTNPDDVQLVINIQTKDDAVWGDISRLNGPKNQLQHIKMVGNKLCFTYKKKKIIFEVKATIEENTIHANFSGIEDSYGKFVFYKESL